MIKTLRSKDKKIEWLKEKTGHWRQHREKCEIVLPNDVTDFRLNVNSVNGNSENTVEDCLDAISEIGHKIEIKLKETVFRSKFSDLKRSEYLRQTELKAVCESCESLVVNNCHFCLKVTPIHPSRVNSPITEINESPLGLMDSELDLLDIMSTWPELFRKTDSTVSQSVRKSVGQSVRKSLKREIPVVNNDLEG